MKIEGRVEKGKLICTLPAAWPIAMRQFNGKDVLVEIDEKRLRRSTKANARHWAVVVPLMQHYLNLKRGPDMIPLSKEQVHYVIVTAFGASEETELGPVPVRSSLMDTKQFHDLDAKAELFLMEQGYSVPEGFDGTVESAMEEMA